MPKLETRLQSLQNYSHMAPKNNLRFDFRYSFTFVSTIAPQLLTDFRDKRVFKSRSSKILVKKSYLILTWLYYLTFTVRKKHKERTIRFAFLPSTRKTYTLTKAPMAHKTFSKEQFAFKYYKFKVSIRASFEEHFSITSVEHAATSLSISKNFFPVFETNMMFLKFYRIQMLSTAPQFYSYYHFLTSC